MHSPCSSVIPSRPSIRLLLRNSSCTVAPCSRVLFSSLSCPSAPVSCLFSGSRTLSSGSLNTSWSSGGLRLSSPSSPSSGSRILMGNDGVWLFAGSIVLGGSILLAMRMFTNTMERTLDRRLDRTLGSAERTVFYGAKTVLHPTFKGIEWAVEPASKWREYEAWKEEHEAGVRVNRGGKVHGGEYDAHGDG